MNIINFNLLLIGIAVIANGILGIIVFLSDRKSITNKTFFFLNLLTICWGAFNYLSNQFSSPEIVIWLLRAAIFFAVWNSLALFQFAYVFPKREIVFPRWYKFGAVPIVAIAAVLTLTPLVLSEIIGFYSNGQVSKVSNGPAIPVFGLVVMGLVFGGIFYLVHKMSHSTTEEKIRFKAMIAGMSLSFSLIIIFNMILPAFFNNADFIFLSPILLLPFIGTSFYAISKYQLFNVKVIITELLVFVIWIIVFVEILTKTSWEERIIESVIFLFVVVFGIFLIRSVRKEVSQREKFELLSKDLAAANAKLQELDQIKTDFISIASHQLRTPLTAIKGYSSMILEGTYGDTSLKIKGAVDKIFQSAQRLIYIVDDLLDVSRIEQGRFQPTFEEVKIANVLKDVVDELKPNAQKKNLDLSFDVSADDAGVKIKADPSKIRQVLTNLVDNAIKYTLSGYVKAELKKDGANVFISVKDSGAGMSQETLSNLFQKFTRAKNVAKLHTDGSGLGLYIAKQIIDAHQGKIWA